jgi:hypothetical protein
MDYNLLDQHLLQNHLPLQGHQRRQEMCLRALLVLVSRRRPPEMSNLHHLDLDSQVAHRSTHVENQFQGLF